MSSLHYPSGLTVDYTYDFANRPLSLSSGGITYISGATYLPFGPEVSVDFANGTRQLRTYDARYRIQRNALASALGVPIADYSYTEDAAGNITSIHDLVDPGYNRDFGYDDLNRLTVANTGPALWGTGSYRYDAMGNMLARDVGGVVEVDPNNPLLTRGRKYSAHADSLPAPGSIHESYAYAGATSKLATVTSGGLDHPLTYDAAGNELRYFDDRTYSARNLMTSIAEPSEDGKPHTINYGYDGRGVRLIRSEGTSGYAAPFATRYYVYSPELQLLAVSDEGPNVWGKTAISNMAPPMKHEIVWFNGRPIAELLNQSIVRYTFTDHLGTPILQTDSNATVTWRAEYEPYGDIFLLRNGTTVGEQPLRFPGQEYERKWEGVEERYNIYRWYRAGWGRYTQPDSFGLAFETNLYVYASDNSVGTVDPLGEASVNVVKTGEQTYSTLAQYQNANPCHVNGTSYSCTERVVERLTCLCKCVGTNLYAMDVSVDVQLKYHLAGGPANPTHAPAVYWNAYRAHEDLHFRDLIAEVTRYANSLEANRYSTMDDCNRGCGAAIGGFGHWLNQWAIDSNRRLH